MPLADFFTAQTPTIADSVADIADAETPTEKQKKFLLLLSLLKDVGSGSRDELTSAVVAAIQRSHSDLLKRLPQRYRQPAIVTEEQYQSYGQSAIRSALRDLSGVIDRIKGLGSALRGGRDRLLRNLIGGRGPLTDADARAKLRDKIVIVRGSDGRDRSYDPANYGELLQDGAEGKAEWDTAKTMSANLNSDLVMISKRSGRDYCDIFAGNIYSVSGTDPRVYPLSIVPGDGNGKMHPRCVHRLYPVPPDFFTDAQLRSHSSLPREFVELGSDAKASIADYQRLFLSRKSEEWGL